MRDRFIRILSVLSHPAVALGGGAVIALAVVGVAWYTTREVPSGATSTVAYAPITAEVDASGSVKAAVDTDLSFQMAGRVNRVAATVGSHVAMGQVLASLDSGAQAAAVSGAEANLEVAQANFASLQSGTRPEQLAIDQTTVTQAASALTSAEASAYVSADDAVHAKADQVFTNPRTTSAMLVVTVPDATLATRVQNERVALEPVLAAWEASIASAASTPVAQVESNLVMVAAFLDDLATALAETPAGGSVSAATLASYQAAVATGRANVSAALSAVTAADSGYKAAEGALMLAQAGATADQIAAGQAAVDAASAALEAAKVSLGETVLTAPVAGTITVDNADIGASASAGVPLISMIADGRYEADLALPQNALGAVKVGEAVEASFDAYPGATFPATVTTIDPSATIENGVTSYTATITFNDNDPRLAPGLAGDFRIITGTTASALVVPSSAIITNGAAQFVYVMGASGVLETPVMTGVTSADGMTQITSGLSAGQKVLTFGAAASE